MSLIKTAVIDSFPDFFFKSLRSLPTEVSDFSSIPASDLAPLLEEIEILIMNSKIRLDKENLPLFKKLKRVYRAGIGLDHFDLDLLKKMGVSVINTPGKNARSVGEQSLGMLLNLTHNISKSNEEVKNHEWFREANRGSEISSMIIGIIGFGNTGSAFGKTLKGFGAKVLAYDKYKEGFGNEFIHEATLEQLFMEADVLSLHIPETAETKNWINSEFLTKLNKPIYLLNLSRGGIVNLKDLLTFLNNGRVKGVALDVLENEKLDRLTEEQKVTYSDLFRRNNVIITPHIGGWSHESLERINNYILKDLGEYLKQSQ